MKRQSNYERQCEEWRQRFLAMDVKDLRARLPELREEGPWLTLRHFGRRLGVRLETGRIEALDDGLPVSVNERLNVYTLFAYCKPGARLTGSWVPFRSLRNAGPFGPAFQRGVVEAYACSASGHMDDLRRAGGILGARLLPQSDLGLELSAFACMPVRYLLWEGDEEFPAQANVLFDESAVDFIHVESVVTVATAGYVRLAAAAGLPLATGAFGME